MSKLSYPETPTVDQTDDYHGTLVSDPYRWLEDTDSQETKAWIKAQNDLTFRYLNQIPNREDIHQRLSELWDYPKQWAPIKRGDRYFQLRNTGLQNQDLLYVFGSLDDEPRLLLDPNTLSEDGTAAVVQWAASPEGRWLAYAVSESGSDWMTWRVRDVDTGDDLPEKLEWSKFSEAYWRKDSSGFYYSRYDSPESGEDYTAQNYYQKVYFHRLGEPQSQDRLIYERPDHKEWGFSAEVSADDRYLVLNVWQGTDVRNRIFYQDLAADQPVVELIPQLEAAYLFVGNDGPVFYFQTNLDAPKGRLIAVDITQPKKDFWRTILPETSDTIETIKRVNGEFIVLTPVSYTHLRAHET